MFNALTHYRHIALFTVFVLISLALLSFNRPANSFIKSSTMVERGVLLVLQPFQEFAAAVTNRVQHIWRSYIALVNLYEKNQKLRKTISSLEAEKNRYIEQALAFERLKGTLRLVEERQFDTILASVIGYDPMNETNTIIVNRGADHGVKESWPVITQDGIVGITMSVSRRSSKVLLLIDPNCNVAAIIQRTRDQGIVGGLTKKEAYTMKYVNRRANIREGATFHLTDRSLVEIAREGVPGYMLTARVFRQLEENGIPPDMLALLEMMLNQKYPNQELFINAIESNIGKEQAEWYEAAILAEARAGILVELEALKDRLFPTEHDFRDALEELIGKEQTQRYADRILPHCKEDEIVVSSGLGGIFPKGLRIGTVSKVVKQDYGLFQEIEIAPSVDFSKLEEVLIIQRESEIEE